MKNSEPQPKIVSQAIAGDTASFGLLYEHYLDEIYHFVYYRVKSHQEAEDLSEAVFLKAWQALDEYPPRDIPFRLWLYRIARNTVYDHYRTRKDHTDLETAAHIPAPVEGPEAILIRWERTAELKECLLKLNEDYQEVLTCRFIVGLSHAETAVVMSRSEQAVRALQYRAIIALRDLLTGEQAPAPAKPYLNGASKSFVPATLEPGYW